MRRAHRCRSVRLLSLSALAAGIAAGEADPEPLLPDPDPTPPVIVESTGSDFEVVAPGTIIADPSMGPKGQRARFNGYCRSPGPREKIPASCRSPRRSSLPPTTDSTSAASPGLPVSRDCFEGPFAFIGTLGTSTIAYAK